MTSWPAHRVGDLCSATEQRDPRRDPADTFRYVDIAGIDRTAKTIVEPTVLLGAEAPSRARKLIRTDDVLVSTVRPNLNAVAMVPEELDGEVASTGFSVLRANRELLEPRYLFYRTISPDFVAALASRVRGASYPAVSDRDVKSVEIRVPPLAEQRRIVEILDQADRLRRLRSESDAKADRILPALFLRMFGDPGTNPMGWPSCALGEIAVLGPQYGANAASTALSDGEPRYLRITDIQDAGRLSKKPVGVDLADWERYRLQDGDLLFARSGATVGKPYIYRDGDGLCVFAGYLIRFRVDAARLHPLVAFAFTQTPFYRKWIERKRRTAAQPNINGREYASLRLPVPDRQLQANFVRFHGRLAAALDASVLAASGLDQLFALILNGAFNGSLTSSWRRKHIRSIRPPREYLADGLAGNGEV